MTEHLLRPAMELLKVHCAFCSIFGAFPLAYAEGEQPRYSRCKMGYLSRTLYLAIFGFVAYVRVTSEMSFVIGDVRENDRKHTAFTGQIRYWRVFMSYVAILHYSFTLTCMITVFNEANLTFVNEYVQNCVNVRADSRLKKILAFCYPLLMIYLLLLIFVFLISKYIYKQRVEGSITFVCGIGLCDLTIIATEQLFLLLLYIALCTLKEIEIGVQNLLFRYVGDTGRLYKLKQREHVAWTRRNDRNLSPYIEIRKLRKAHNLCLDLMEELCERYCWHLLIITAFNFIFLIFHFYVLSFKVYMILWEKTPVMFDQLISLAAACALYIFRLWLPCACDDMINGQIKSLDRALDRLLLCTDISKLIFYKVKFFQYQNHIRTFKVSVLGLFNLDSAFFYSVLGAVLAYSVVLVQLSSNTVKQIPLVSNLTKLIHFQYA